MQSKVDVIEKKNIHIYTNKLKNKHSNEYRDQNITNIQTQYQTKGARSRSQGVMKKITVVQTHDLEF